MDELHSKPVLIKLEKQNTKLGRDRAPMHSVWRDPISNGFPAACHLCCTIVSRYIPITHPKYPNLFSTPPLDTKNSVMLS
eukprot:3372255-Ditylum_brightwellii.AAC.1